jgi:hypothetical protein
VNLAGDPRHADKLKEMESLLLAEMRRYDDPWRLWDQPDDGLTPPPAGQGKANGAGKANMGNGANAGNRSGKKKKQNQPAAGGASGG